MLCQLFHQTNTVQYICIYIVYIGDEFFFSPFYSKVSEILYPYNSQNIKTPHFVGTFLGVIRERGIRGTDINVKLCI